MILGWIFSIPLAVQTSIAYKTNPPDGAGNLFLSRPVTELLFYTSLWAVKVSFLIFFKRIGICALDKVRKYWLSVFAFTILVYLVLWTLDPYSCWAVKGIAKCEREPSVGMLTSIAFILAARYLNILHYIFKLTYITLGSTAFLFRRKDQRKANKNL